MIRGEISRGIDLDVSWRDIFSYEEIKEIGYFICVGRPVCGFVCGKVVEVVGYYAVEEVFASYCNQSATPLGDVRNDDIRRNLGIPTVKEAIISGKIKGKNSYVTGYLR